LKTSRKCSDRKTADEFAAPFAYAGGAFLLETIMNIVAFDRDRLTNFVLIWMYVFVLAVFDHIERVTGRTDYENFEYVWPENEVVQQLWRAKSTSDQVRKLVADADLIRRLRGTSLLSCAESYAEQLVATLRVDLLQR
jgi:hypothetical protein